MTPRKMTKVPIEFHWYYKEPSSLQPARCRKDSTILSRTLYPVPPRILTFRVQYFPRVREPPLESACEAIQMILRASIMWLFSILS